MSVGTMSKRIGSLFFGLMLVAATGCSSKDAQKCSSALATTRQALTGKDFALANQWREYAYKQCEDQSQLSQIDKEIVEAQAAVEKEKAAKAKTLATHQQLLSVFKDWVASSRTAPERSVANATCEGASDAALEKSKERFCSGTRAVTGVEATAFAVRYWQKTAADAVLFSVRLPLPVTCNDLGGNRVLKEIQLGSTTGGTVKRTYCELTDGSLAGLQAVATEANNSELRILAPKYLEQDPALRMQLK